MVLLAFVVLALLVLTEIHIPTPLWVCVVNNICKELSNSIIYETTQSYIYFIDPMCHIFLETLGKIQYIDYDFKYHGRHQDDQKAQEHSQSTRVFLMALFHY